MNLRQQYPNVNDRTFRSVVRLGAKQSEASEIFPSARDLLMRWLEAFSVQHVGSSLADVRGEQTATDFRVEGRTARFRIVDSDDAGSLSPYGVSYATAESGRAKTGDVTLRVVDGHVLLEEHLSTNADEVVPEITIFLARHGLVYDGDKQLRESPGHVNDHETLLDLWARLTNTDRTLPIVVASEPYRVNVTDLARRLYCSAQVFSISNNMTFALKDLGGRDLAVFGGAVRFYSDLSSDSQHYVMLGNAIGAASLSGRADQLIDAAAHRALRKMNQRSRAYSVVDAEAELKSPRLERTAAAIPFVPLQAVPPLQAPSETPQDVALAAIDENGDHEVLYRVEDDIATLRAENRQLKDDLDLLETNYLTLLDEREREHARADKHDAQSAGESAMYHPFVHNLLASVQLMQEAAHDIQVQFAANQNEIDRTQRESYRLRTRLSRLEKALGTQPLQRPTTLAPDAIDEWVDHRFEGRLELHQRAMAALADSQYVDVESVLRGLEILGDQYHAMRQRTSDNDEPKNAFEEALKDEHLRFSGAISDNAFGSYRRLYTVPYANGERRLDFHLRNGSSTADPKRCLRIYFFWDDDDKKVVIGHLPSHLPNSMS